MNKEREYIFQRIEKRQEWRKNDKLEEQEMETETERIKEERIW